MAQKHNKLDYYGVVDGGHIKARDPNIKEKVAYFSEVNDGRDIHVTLDVVRDAVSMAQHRFFHGVVVPACCNATGETDRERMKIYLKGMYLIDVIEVLGEPIPDVPSLTKLSKDVMAHFIENCMEFLADNGGIINGDEIDKYETIINEATEQLNLFPKE